MATRDGSGMVRAAGGVVWRRRPDGEVEVLVVHRPRYVDWSFPKGKWEESDADDAACAVREVAEETGCSVELGRELPSVSYRDAKLRPKRVRYWSMRSTGGTFTPNGEVDEVRWLPLAPARELLTYSYDRVVLDALAGSVAELPPG